MPCRCGSGRQASWAPWAWLRAVGPTDQVSASRDPACGEQARGSEWATSGCLLTGWPPPQPAPRAQRRLRGRGDAPPTRSTPTAGSAKKEMAKTEKQEAMVFPTHVCGTLSP